MPNPGSNAVTSVITFPVTWLPLPRKFTPADAARWIRLFRKVFRSPSIPAAELPSSVMTLPDSTFPLPTTNSEAELCRRTLSATRLFDASRNSMPICGLLRIAFRVTVLPAEEMTPMPSPFAVTLRPVSRFPAPPSTTTPVANPVTVPFCTVTPCRPASRMPCFGVSRADAVAGDPVPGQIEHDVVRTDRQRGAGAAGEVVRGHGAHQGIIPARN